MPLDDGEPSDIETDGEMDSEDEAAVKRLTDLIEQELHAATVEEAAEATAKAAADLASQAAVRLEAVRARADDGGARKKQKGTAPADAAAAAQPAAG